MRKTILNDLLSSLMFVWFVACCFESKFHQAQVVINAAEMEVAADANAEVANGPMLTPVEDPASEQDEGINIALLIVVVSIVFFSATSGLLIHLLKCAPRGENYY